MNAIRRFFLTFLLALALPTLAAAQVDINSADAKTLAETLNGVGLVKAEAIVAYRSTNGPFKTVDELAKVKGIGAKTIAANRDAIVIVEPKTEAGAPAVTGKPLAAR
ncbi:MAG: helix-hairpin-helix domain-containing protein [Dokdonella sp.]